MQEPVRWNGQSTHAQTVLITGGAGYIGSLLSRRLLGDGYSVRVLDSLLYGEDPILELRGQPGYRLIIGDFRIPHVADLALQGVDAVVHLGAIVGDPACSIDEMFTIDTNFHATRTLVKACRRAGVQRFIFASTCSVYGASDGELDERSPLNPVSLYANTKIASESYLLSEADDTFAPVILRFGTAFGTSFRQRFDLVINLLAAKAAIDGVITIHGGDQWRPFIHADDIGKAIERVLRAPLADVAGEIFNVGVTGLNFQIGTIGRFVQEAVPSARVEIIDEIVDRRNYYVNFAKLQQRVGFTPERDMFTAIGELADAARELGDYRAPILNNQVYLTTEGIPRGAVLTEDGGYSDVYIRALNGTGGIHGR